MNRQRTKNWKKRKLRHRADQKWAKRAIRYLEDRPWVNIVISDNYSFRGVSSIKFIDYMMSLKWEGDRIVHPLVLRCRPFCRG